MKEETKKKKDLLKELKSLQRKIDRLEKANRKLSSSQAEEIRRSEEKYHKIFEESFDGLFISSPQGKILDINKSGLLISGYDSKEEVFKLNLGTNVYPNPEDRQRILSMVNSQGSAEYEVEFKKKGGEIRNVHCSLVAVKDSSGVISSYRGIIRDISVQKQSEKTLRRLNRELRAISSCNQTLLRAVDEQALLNEICRIICDEAGYRMAWVGYVEHDEAKTVRPVAWAGSDSSGYVANASLSWAGDNERGQGPAGKTVRSGGICYVQDFTTDPQMTPWRQSAFECGYRSIITLPLKDESGKVFGILLIYSSEPNAITPDEIRLLDELANDLAFGITGLRIREEHKRMEAEVIESRERFQMVFENAFDGISIFSEDPDPFKRKLIDCNEQYAFLAGRSRQELLQLESLQTLMVPLEDTTNINRLESLNRGTAYQGYSSWIRPDGKENVIEYVGMPITWRGKAYTIGIDRDITDRKRAENERNQMLEELIAAKEKAEQSGKLKSEFLSQVSHEIRTPLITIVSYTNLIKEDFKEGRIDSLYEYLESLSNSGERLERTFNLIVNAAQVLTNNYEPNFKALNLVQDILLHIYSEFEKQAERKGLDYIFIDNSKDKNIIADQYSVNQLFSNLFDNAIKYTKKGFVKIEVIQENESVFVKVSDSGIGISGDFLPYIFEPFRQEEQGYSRKFEGNGLGLMLTKKYCEMNNAEMVVESIKGEGSTFTVKFNLHY